MHKVSSKLVTTVFFASVIVSGIAAYPRPAEATLWRSYGPTECKLLQDTGNTESSKLALDFATFGQLANNDGQYVAELACPVVEADDLDLTASGNTAYGYFYANGTTGSGNCEGFSPLSHELTMEACITYASGTSGGGACGSASTYNSTQGTTELTINGSGLNSWTSSSHTYDAYWLYVGLNCQNLSSSDDVLFSYGVTH